MPLVTGKDILADARNRGYGVGSLMGSDLAMVLGLIRAAEEIGSPLLLVFNQEVNPGIPIEHGMPMIANAAAHARVPVSPVLDHAHDLELIHKAIECGAGTVMYDGSMLPFEENVARTREVVELAHRRGVSVEAELGSISGSSVDFDDLGPEASFTDPQVAAEFVARTGVDILAISFGNAHGLYRGEPRLDLDRVRAIFAQVDVPLAMHGASGLEAARYPEIVAAGISKVCYYTALARVSARAVLDRLGETGPDLAYHDITAYSIDVFYQEGKALMSLFGGAGKAAGIVPAG